MTDFIKIELGSSFLLNAGMCGMVNFLKYNEAIEGTDYVINSQELLISKDYIRNNDLPTMYVDTTVALLGTDCKLAKAVKDQTKVKALHDRLDSLSKTESADLRAMYDSFTDMMLKNSIVSGYTIIQKYYPEVTPITEDLVKQLKAEKDLVAKYPIYQNIMELLKQKTVYNVLAFKQLTYSKLKLFFDGSEFSAKNNNTKANPISAAEIFNTDFYKPLFAEFDTPDKKKTHYCIECMTKSANTKAISFMSDTTDDVRRKTNHYWNFNADAFICPTCALMYAFAPLGFAYSNDDCIFVNSNANLPNLIAVMSTYKTQQDCVAYASSYTRLFKVFTSTKLNMLSERLDNFQVVLKEADSDHFRFSVVDANMIKKLQYGSKQLEWLENKWITTGMKDGKPVRLSVYTELINCIIRKRTLYPLIQQIIRCELKDRHDINYVWYLEQLQILFYGGNAMEDIKKYASLAYREGIKLRVRLLEGEFVKIPEDSEKIRGITYRLLNLVSVNDKTQFIDSVLRLYSSINWTVPAVFAQCYGASDELFAAVGHSFVLGLKYMNRSANKEENSNE